jgi:hypothetical protein
LLNAPGARPKSGKGTGSRNSSNGKSSKISNKTAVSTFIEGNYLFNLQKYKWDKNAGSNQKNILIILD